jgi:hypothetical protein
MKNNSRTKGNAKRTNYRTPSTFKIRQNIKVTKHQIVRRTHM